MSKEDPLLRKIIHVDLDAFYASVEKGLLSTKRGRNSGESLTISATRSSTMSGFREYSQSRPNNKSFKVRAGESCMGSINFSSLSR
jgi:hypothetical protein